MSVRPALRRFQRRLRTSVFARCVPVVSAVALGVVGIALLTFRPGETVATIAAAGALVFAALSAWIIALVRTPSLAVTAQMIDERLGLENRAVTALQFAEAPDPMSRLAVAEATSRLEAIPVSFLPLGVSAPYRGAAVAALAASTLFVVSLGTREAVPVGGVVPGESSAGTRLRVERPTTNGMRAGGTGTAGTRTAAPQTATGTLASRRERNQVDGHQARGGTRQTTGDSPPPSPADNGGSGPGEPASVPDRRDEAGPSSQGASEGGRRVDGRVGAAWRTGSDPWAAGRGASGAAPGGAGGGVGGGALVPPFPRTLSSWPPTLTAVDATAYRDAYSRAESAMTKTRIPTRFRSYVRDYFVAIRPQPEP